MSQDECPGFKLNRIKVEVSFKVRVSVRVRVRH